MKKSERLAIRVTPLLKDGLQQMADEQDRKLHFVAGKILEKAVERWQKRRKAK